MLVSAYQKTYSAFSNMNTPLGFPLPIMDEMEEIKSLSDLIAVDYLTDETLNEMGEDNF